MSLVLLVLACVETADDSNASSQTCTPTDAPELRIGTGELSYQALEGEGAPIELVHGPQGGYHVVLAPETEGADGSSYWVAEMRGYLDGVERARAVPYVTMQCNPQTGTLQSWGYLLIWEAEPEELDGQLVHIEVDTTDSAGVALYAEADFTIDDPLVR